MPNSQDLMLRLARRLRVSLMERIYTNTAYLIKMLGKLLLLKFLEVTMLRYSKTKRGALKLFHLLS
jgi:hypothetical protein